MLSYDTVIQRTNLFFQKLVNNEYYLRPYIQTLTYKHLNHKQHIYMAVNVIMKPNLLLRLKIIMTTAAVLYL